MAIEGLDGFEKLNRDLRTLASGLRSQKLLNRIGLASIRLIRSRTRRGQSVDGTSFPGYSEGHAERREAKGLPTQFVNLQFDLYESMLGYLDHVVSRDLESVVVEITDVEKEEIGGYHHRGEGNNPERRFMAHSDEETEQMAELVGDHIDDVFRLANFT